MKRSKFPCVITWIALCAFVLMVSTLHAEWIHDGAAICTATGQQEFPEIVSDGAGGAIIAWSDYRSGEWDVYAQRIDASGVPLWAANGVAICTAAGLQEIPQIVSDGAGGAIVTWDDARGGHWNIYAQRVDASGIPMWTADGVPVCLAPNTQGVSEIISDGVGGAIVTWEDYRSGTNWDIYAQRMDEHGMPLWTFNGVAACTSTTDQIYPQIVSDGAEGAIITWEDGIYVSGMYDIYAQRVSASGTPLWTTNGVAVCTSECSKWFPVLVADGAGGAIITWEDERAGLEVYDIYAQRVNASGTPLWTTNGVAVCTEPEEQSGQVITSDGSGGAIIAWQDWRSESLDIYAQRIDASGIPLWTTAGVPICTAADEQFPPCVTSDGSGGAIFTWQDNRTASWDYDIYAQRVDSSGVAKWSSNGVEICMAANGQFRPRIVLDGASGATITWEDRRSDNGDIYAQRVKANGTTDLLFASASATVTGDYVIVSWQLTVCVPASSFRIERSETSDGEYRDLELDVLRDSQYSFSCVDYSVLPGSTYWYKIVLEGSAGEESCGPIEVHVDAAPIVYAAHQSYPNPFNPMCTIRYDIPTAGSVSLRVFDVSGSTVRTLVNAWREPGIYSELWDGKADDGSALPSGVYFYSLKAGDFVAARKMVLLK